MAALLLTPEAQRVRSFAFGVATMLVGLGWHLAHLPTNSLHDIVGDVLWAMMMAWLIAAVLPTVHVLIVSTIALGVCVAVEFSQLLHTPTLDAVRSTILGRLVLGSGFDPRDLVAYAVGVTIVAVVRWPRATRS